MVVFILMVRPYLRSELKLKKKLLKVLIRVCGNI